LHRLFLFRFARLILSKKPCQCYLREPHRLQTMWLLRRALAWLLAENTYSLANIKRNSLCTFIQGPFIQYKDILRCFSPGNVARVQNCLCADGITFLWRRRPRMLTDDHFAAVHYVMQITPRITVQYFDRIIVHGEVIHCHKYC